MARNPRGAGAYIINARGYAREAIDMAMGIARSIVLVRFIVLVAFRLRVMSVP